MSLEFIPGRRYRFFDTVGEHVGTFLGTRHGKLHFRDVVTILDTCVELTASVDARGILDAEPWLQSLPFADTKMFDEAERLVASRGSHKPVEIARPTVAEWKKHTQS